jgi:hypothetical protein
MTNKSPLRQLANEYYEGQISRADYVEQRQHLIESLVDDGDGLVPRDSSQSTTQPALFQGLGSAQPDSTDLANALANRGDDFSVAAEEIEPDPHVTAPMERIDIETETETETSSEQLRSHADDSISKAPNSSSLILKLLLVLLLLAGCFLWLR